MVLNRESYLIQVFTKVDLNSKHLKDVISFDKSRDTNEVIV